MSDEEITAKSRLLEALLARIDEKQDIVDALEDEVTLLTRRVDEAPRQQPRKVRFAASIPQKADADSTPSVTKTFELAKARRSKHAQLERLIHTKQHLADELENSRRTITDVNEEINMKKASHQTTLPSSPGTDLSLLIDKINDLETEIASVVAESVAVDGKRAFIRGNVDDMDKMRTPEHIETLNQAGANLRERNDRLSNETSTLNWRYHRLLPIATKWRDSGGSVEAHDDLEDKSIDDLLDIVAGKLVRVTSKKCKLDSLDMNRADFHDQMDLFLSERSRLLFDIHKAKTRNGETEARLVRDINRLRIRCAQQSIRRRKVVNK